MTNVSFSTAKLLKELNINTPCKLKFDAFGNLVYGSNTYTLATVNKSGEYLAPSQHEVIDYIRLHHRIYFSLFFVTEIRMWTISIYDMDGNLHTSPYEISSLNYILCVEEAITKALFIIKESKKVITVEDLITYSTL